MGLGHPTDLKGGLRELPGGPGRSGRGFLGVREERVRVEAWEGAWVQGGDPWLPWDRLRSLRELQRPPLMKMIEK